MKEQDKGIIGIYKITSPSGRVYIGQSLNIEKIGKKQEPEFAEMVRKMHSKCILQLDVEGNIIKEWGSIKEAADTTLIHRENIGCVLRKITKTAGGFIWEYKN